MPVLQVGETAIPYDLRRSADVRERRITVTPDRVEVVTPLNDLDQDLDAFLARKRQWVFDSVQELREIAARRPTVPRFMSGSKVPFRGRLSRLTVRRTDGPHIEIAHRNGFLVDLPAWVETDQAEAIVAMELKLWLKRQARRDVLDIARAYGKRFGLKPRSIRVAELSSGWGSCGAEGTVHINWHLVFAPKKVLEYVVAHELAHLKHRSHGAEFWAFIEFMLPDYRRPKAWLDAHQGTLDAGFLSSVRGGDSNIKGSAR